MFHTFLDTLVSQKKSEHTISTYERELQSLFNWLDATHKKKKELYEITFKDLTLYLKNKENTSNSRTINKQITIFKRFFFFLWDNGYIPYDPATKLKTIKIDRINALNFSYEDLLKVKANILNSTEWSVGTKTIFVLAMKGLRNLEYHFTKNDVKDNVTEDTVSIYTNSRIVKLDGADKNAFLEYFYNNATFNESSFVFETKKHDGTIVPIEDMTLQVQFKRISKAYELNDLSIRNIRAAYANYLHKTELYTTEELAAYFAIEHNSAALLIDRTNRQLEDYYIERNSR